MRKDKGRARSASPDATIMLVDDEPTTLDVIEMFLRAEGYTRFIKSADARCTLDLLREQRPHLLLLNLKMPHVDGLELLGLIRSNELLADIPVIIVTSSTDGDTKRRALEHGATDFLCKPVDPSELALRVRNTLAASAQRRHRRPAGRGSKGVTRTPKASAGTLPPAGDPLVSRLEGIGPRSRTIIATFVRRLHEKLAAIEVAHAADDYDELVNLAHWLKGAAGTVGFDAFTGPAETLRQLARERKSEGIEAQISELRGLVDRIAVPGDDRA
jgi:CheY-like chemotaxis protein